MPKFSSIFLSFLVNQTQKHKHKHKSISNKNTNTNPAIDLSCQPNTLKKKHTHTHIPKNQQEYKHKPINPSSATTQQSIFDKIFLLFETKHKITTIRDPKANDPKLNSNERSKISKPTTSTSTSFNPSPIFKPIATIQSSTSILS